MVSVARKKKNSIYIKNHSGRTVYFDRELLQDAITNAVVSSGSTRVSLAEDISYAIEKYLESLRDSKAAMPELRELNSSVVNLLSNAGHDEIAHAYASLHTADWNPQEARELKEWNAVVVQEFISGNPFFQSYDSDVLTLEICTHLTSLGFTKVTDSLIIELASHIIANDVSRESEPDKSGAASFYLTSVEIVAFSRKSCKPWFEKTVLQARDISIEFPKLHIDFNFLNYVQEVSKSSEMALMELMFIPQLSSFIRTVAESFVKVIQFIEETYPDAMIPCFFTVDTVDSALNDCFNLRGRAKMQLRQELTEVIEREFSSVCDSAVRIVYIKEE